MKINWVLLSVVAVVLVFLIVFILKKNQKDKKELTQFLNNDYKKSEDEDRDFDNVGER